MIEGTFCHSLFERSFFDEKLLSDLINNSEAFLKENECDKDVLNLLSWVFNGVDQCFTSHNDENDYYLEVIWLSVSGAMKLNIIGQC